MKIKMPISDIRDPELGGSRVMTKADFQFIFDELFQQASNMLNEAGKLTPTLCIPSMGPNGIARMEMMPVGDLVNQPVGKDIIAMLMSRLIEDANHDFVVFTHEAWVLQGNDQSSESIDRLRAATHQSLADHPERTEAVVMTLHSKNMQALAVIPITRQSDGKVKHLASVSLIFPGEDGCSLEGRFVAPQRPEGSTLH